jgi:hypothetical protein
MGSWEGTRGGVAAEALPIVIEFSVTQDRHPNWMPVNKTELCLPLYMTSEPPQRAVALSVEANEAVAKSEGERGSDRGEKQWWAGCGYSS